jgi:hypothetical protein
MELCFLSDYEYLGSCFVSFAPAGFNLRRTILFATIRRFGVYFNLFFWGPRFTLLFGWFCAIQQSVNVGNFLSYIAQQAFYPSQPFTDFFFICGSSSCLVQ